MKLEVGMYIRTDKGFITKVKEFKHDYTKGKRLVDDYSVKEVVENYLSLDGNQCRIIESIDYSIPPCYPSDEELDKIKSHILKASYNIVDILEVGDIIRYRIDKVSLETKGYLTGVIDIADEEMIESIKEDKNYHVLQILTKEEFERKAYKVKE